jgi:hypothetical protein
LRHDKELSNSIRLTEQWWFKLYFAVPPCAKGRLTQTTGTCWFNSTINTLLLTSDIAKKLKEKWNMLSEDMKTSISQMSFETYFTASASLKSLLWFIVYKVLVEEKKLAVHDGDVSQKVAALVKGKNEGLSQNVVKSINLYGDEYSSNDGLDVILNEFFPEDKDLVYFNFVNMINRLIEQYKQLQGRQVTKQNSNFNKFFVEITQIKDDLSKLQNEEKQKYEELEILDHEENTLLKQESDNISEWTRINNDMKKSGLDKTESQRLMKELEEVKRLIINIKLKLKENNNKINDISEEYEILKEKVKIKSDRLESVFLSYKLKIREIKMKASLDAIEDSLVKELLNGGTPSVLAIALQNPLKSAPETLVLNNIRYKLQASGINIGGIHTIAGLTCDGERYIFDSNNYLSYDNWPAGDISNYLEKFNKTSVYGGILYVIYIRDDTMNGGKKKRKSAKKRT